MAQSDKTCSIVDTYKKQGKLCQTGNKLVGISCLLRSICVFLVHKKQGRSKVKLLDLLKWSRTKAVWKIIQLLHVTVATSYQDATVRKIYNYLTGFSELGTIWNQQISKALRCMQWLSLPFAALVSFLPISRVHGIA